MMSGEFGTSRQQWLVAPLGAASSSLAGGAAPGQMIGSTSRNAEEPVERPSICRTLPYGLSAVGIDQTLF